jgi:hypothetical protein
MIMYLAGFMLFPLQSNLHTPDLRDFESSGGTVKEACEVVLEHPGPFEQHGRRGR